MTLLDDTRAELDILAAANLAFAKRYPGDRATRQPVHTVYGGAHLFKAETARRIGELALQSLRTYGGDLVEFARGIGFVEAGAFDGRDASSLAERFARDADALRRSDPSAWLAAAVYDRVWKKLER